MPYHQLWHVFVCKCIKRPELHYSLGTQLPPLCPCRSESKIHFFWTQPGCHPSHLRPWSLRVPTLPEATGRAGSPCIRSPHAASQQSEQLEPTAPSSSSLSTIRVRDCQASFLKREGPCPALLQGKCSIAYFNIQLASFSVPRKLYKQQELFKI